MLSNVSELRYLPKLRIATYFAVIFATKGYTSISMAVVADVFRKSEKIDYGNQLERSEVRM